MTLIKPTFAQGALLAAVAGIALVPGSAPASTKSSQSRAPIVKTGPVEEVMSTTAKLTGKLNDHGVTSFYEFDWGFTRKYGHKTQLKSAGSKDKTVDAAQVLKRLKPGRVYHYRLVVISSSPTYGGDRSFKTT